MKYIATLTLVMIAISGLARAGSDTAWKHGCDADRELFRCILLVARYDKGTAPFPQDAERAASLRQSALRSASEQCHQSDPDACRHSAGLIATDTTRKAEARADALIKLVNFMVSRCTEGDPYLCKEIINFVAHRNVLAFRKVLKETDPGMATNIETAFEAARRIGFENRTSAGLLEAEHNADCKGGDTNACIAAARLHVDMRRPITQDPRIISRLLDECLTDHGECRDAHFFLRRLIDKDTDRHQSFLSLFRSSCSDDRPLHCFIAAGGAAEFDGEALQNAVQQNCQNGVAFRCILVGERYLYEGLRPRSVTTDEGSLRKARHWFRLGCEHGASYACHVLEHMDSL